jgi:non-ribosomal peptide synthase protein (TIGR01720 family)
MLGAGDSLLLEGAPRVFGAQVGEVLLAALGPALAEWAGGAVLVDVEGHGREDLFDDVDLSRTVGWFTNIFPVVLTAAGGPQAVALVRDRLRALPAGGIGYGLLRYLSGDEDVAGRLRALPQAEVSFNYLGRHAEGGREGSFGRPGAGALGPTSSPGDDRPHLLEVVCAASGDHLRVSIRYSGEVHRLTTVEALAGSFLESLGALLRAGQPTGDPTHGTRTRTGQPLLAGVNRAGIVGGSNA